MVVGFIAVCLIEFVFALLSCCSDLLVQVHLCFLFELFLVYSFWFYSVSLASFFFVTSVHVKFLVRSHVVTAVVSCFIFVGSVCLPSVFSPVITSCISPVSRCLSCPGLANYFNPPCVIKSVCSLSFISLCVYSVYCVCASVPWICPNLLYYWGITLLGSELFLSYQV